MPCSPLVRKVTLKYTMQMLLWLSSVFLSIKQIFIQFTGTLTLLFGMNCPNSIIENKGIWTLLSKLIPLDVRAIWLWYLSPQWLPGLISLICWLGRCSFPPSLAPCVSLQKLLPQSKRTTIPTSGGPAFGQGYKIAVLLCWNLQTSSENQLPYTPPPRYTIDISNFTSRKSNSYILIVFPILLHSVLCWGFQFLVIAIVISN